MVNDFNLNNINKDISKLEFYKINNIDKYCSHIIKFRSQEAIELLTIVTIILWPVSIFFSYFAINFNSLPNMKPLNISNITLILFILTFIGILVMCLRDTNIIYYLKIFIYNIDTDTKKIPIKINKINKKWNKSK